MLRKQSPAIVVPKKSLYAILVRDQHTLPHDGSRSQRVEIHRMIRKSQCLLN